ncbi:T9SS type A sorting domain-containing protein [Pontibacter sp. G13]|uniref:T9SS type A sorting domain-containing protein n=1 Tax=Pontibacter sp. G13 TaxID=3074898 RepID=UPI00288AB439|nr:T9SS type A sorting domain-containing protein [Pontibacter sp. G13]WNJ17967.1 T9SS type A sorting domain-containing protein [Pontibacter sp. G13]
MRHKLLLLLLISFISMAPLSANNHPWIDSPSTEDASIKIETSIYPNPSTGVFYVEVLTAAELAYQVKIVNLIGQTVVNEKVKSGEKVKFDLTSFPKGVYFVQVDNGVDQVIQRVVLQ